jgi:hypothetical protein
MNHKQGVKSERLVDLNNRLGLYRQQKISDLKKRFSEEKGEHKKIDACEYDIGFITKVIDEYGSNVFLTIENLDIIPETWKREVKRKGKKINQCECVQHTPSYEIKLKRNPLRTFSDLFYDLQRNENVYPSFFWYTQESRSSRIDFRIVDLFESDLIKLTSEIIGEKIKLSGSGNELSAKIPSRSQKSLKRLLKYGAKKIKLEDIKYWEPAIAGLKRKEEKDFSDWYKLLVNCGCWITKMNTIHYKDSCLCPHIILAIKESEKLDYLKYFPEITDNARNFFNTISYQVRKKTKKYGRQPLTKTEKDIFLQNYLKTFGKKYIFDFSL